MEKYIFQTHKSFKYIQSKKKLLDGVKSWMNSSHKFKYFFYDNEMCDNFIFTNFSADIYKAYKKLPLDVMKADLWRYCVIYFFGGIYADTDTIVKINPHIFLNDSLLTVVAENKTHICQWFFAAPKKSPILRIIIDLAVERILTIKKIKGEHIIHYLTGPGVFTDGIRKYLINNNKHNYNNQKKYFYNQIPEIKFLNHNIFHNKLIIHLYAGQDDDGWYHERFLKLI